MARRRKLADRAGRHDPAYRRAKRENYAGRAIYKLVELDRRFRLLKPGARVLDLGCWPGSWLQYAGERVGSTGRVLGLDLRPVSIALPAHVTHAVADAGAPETRTLLADEGPFDVVLSDMAPKTTGDRHTDQWRSEALCALALDLAGAHLRPGGHFAAKVFQGGGLPQLLARVRACFSEARSAHPKATRSGSSELYVVGRGLRAGISR